MPKGPRKDPAKLPLDGIVDHNSVVNPEPGRRYVLVSETSELRGPDYYEMLGYEPVLYKGKTGTRLAAGKWKEGEHVRAFSQMLMSIDEETYAQLEQYGPNGLGGQAYLDKIEAQMSHSNRGGIDAVKSRGPIRAATMATQQWEADETSFLST